MQLPVKSKIDLGNVHGVRISETPPFSNICHPSNTNPCGSKAASSGKESPTYDDLVHDAFLYSWIWKSLEPPGLRANLTVAGN